jgi:hypothetical protein
MDKNTLVSSGQALVDQLDKSGLKPRAAMWVHSDDTDTWKLWIVPPENFTDKHDFYRQVSVVVAKNRQSLNGIDASDTEMIKDSHPAIRGLRNFIKAPGLQSISFAGNTFNGFYLPDGIILRSDL